MIQKPIFVGTCNLTGSRMLLANTFYTLQPSEPAATGKIDQNHIVWVKFCTCYQLKVEKLLEWVDSGIIYDFNQ